MKGNVKWENDRFLYLITQFDHKVVGCYVIQFLESWLVGLHQWFRTLNTNSFPYPEDKCRIRSEIKVHHLMYFNHGIEPQFYSLGGSIWMLQRRAILEHNCNTLTLLSYLGNLCLYAVSLLTKGAWSIMCQQLPGCCNVLGVEGRVRVTLWYK